MPEPDKSYRWQRPGRALLKMMQCSGHTRVEGLGLFRVLGLGFEVSRTCRSFQNEA